MTQYTDFVRDFINAGKGNLTDAAASWRASGRASGKVSKKSPKSKECTPKFIAKCAARSPARLCRTGATGRRSCALPEGGHLPAGHKHAGRPKGSKNKKSPGVSMSFRSPMRMRSPLMRFF